jgi:hypothetical protein
MNLQDLDDRFAAFVAAVRARIEADGKQDSYAVLHPKPGHKLSATTVAPLEFYAEMRLPLQKPASIDDLADKFVRDWRAAMADDESV